MVFDTPEPTEQFLWRGLERNWTFLEKYRRMRSNFNKFLMKNAPGTYQEWIGDISQSYERLREDLSHKLEYFEALFHDWLDDLRTEKFLRLEQKAIKALQRSYKYAKKHGLEGILLEGRNEINGIVEKE